MKVKELFTMVENANKLNALLGDKTIGILCSSDFKTNKTAAKTLIKEIMQEKGEFIKNSISGAINKGIKSPLYSA